MSDNEPKIVPMDLQDEDAEPLQAALENLMLIMHRRGYDRIEVNRDGMRLAVHFDTVGDEAKDRVALAADVIKGDDWPDEI